MLYKNRFCVKNCSVLLSKTLENGNANEGWFNFFWKGGGGGVHFFDKKKLKSGIFNGKKNHTHMACNRVLNASPSTSNSPKLVNP